jgi:SAM-dependent methyltransferase
VEPTAPPSDPFSAERLAKIARMERRHFWFAARRRTVRRLLDRWVPRGAGTTADLGCGTGSMVQALIADGRPAVGLDRREEGLRATVRAAPCAPFVRGDVLRLPFRDGAFGAVLLLDVLEHVDDRAALAEARRVLAPDGRLVATVPAFRWLWSARDEDAGHLRRYTRSELVARVAEAGFDVDEAAYGFVVLLPALVVTRHLGRGNRRWRDREDDVPRFLNAVFGAACAAEHALSTFVRWPAGTSVHLAARRR